MASKLQFLSSISLQQCSTSPPLLSPFPCPRSHLSLLPHHRSFPSNRAFNLAFRCCASSSNKDSILASGDSSNGAPEVRHFKSHHKGPAFDSGEPICGEIKAKTSGKEAPWRISSSREPPLSLAELLVKSQIPSSVVYGDTNVLVSGMQIDSREVKSGDLFVCCKGLKTDGHLFVSDACELGAVAIVANKEHKDQVFSCGKPVVLVDDTNSVLPILSATLFGHPSKSLTVVGITGTNGKTTTTNLVKGVFEAMGRKAGMLGTLGYYIREDNLLEAPNTTPDALTIQRLMAEMVVDGNNAVVMEASSHGLELGRCDEVDFDVAVFTNLTRDHLDFHGSEEEYRRSKGKLFARMVDPNRHRKVVNLDDPHAWYFIRQGNPDVPTVTFGMENKDADVSLLKCELSLFKTSVSIDTPKGTLEIVSGMLGRYNIYNILAAVAVGVALDANTDDIVRGIEKVDRVPGRCELIDEGQPFAVVVDYAHTPDALSRLLDAMRELNPQRIVTVFGCGGDRDQGKRPMMSKVAAEKSDVVILTSDNPRTEDPLKILDDMLAGIGLTMKEFIQYGGNNGHLKLPNKCALFVHDARRVALQAAIAMGKEGDIIVVAGKGHETYQIEGSTKRFFDDRIECQEALHYVHELKQAGIDINESLWG